MQIFTPQMLLEMFRQIQEVKQMLFDTILAAASRNVLEYFGDSWAALVRHNWHSLPTVLVCFIGGVTLLYCLVRSKPLMTLRSIFDK